MHTHIFVHNFLNLRSSFGNLTLFTCHILHVGPFRYIQMSSSKTNKENSSNIIQVQVTLRYLTSLLLTDFRLFTVLCYCKQYYSRYFDLIYMYVISFWFCYLITSKNSDSDNSMHIKAQGKKE